MQKEVADRYTILLAIEASVDNDDTSLSKIFFFFFYIEKARNNDSGRGIPANLEPLNPFEFFNLCQHLSEPPFRCQNKQKRGREGLPACDPFEEKKIPTGLLLTRTENFTVENTNMYPPYPYISKHHLL